jgi:hypothetical protein
LGDAVRYMLGGSMAVLDTAAKYREVLLFNRYQAGRDNIERFRSEPPFAYVIPREQRDLPTAAILVEKLIVNGIEVHRAAQPFAANGREYRNAWVVLMDQPFAPLVKELFEPQHYPDLRESPNGPPIRPYDVAGWTLPTQMGVEVAAVLQPVTTEQRAGLEPIKEVTPPEGGVEGTGAAYVIGHRANASFKAINEALKAGAQVGFAQADGEAGAMVVSGIDRERMAEIARKYSVNAVAVAKPPQDAVSTRKPRVGLYRSWVPNIDEGWTRWILEDYGFAPITLRNGDIQAGHLRERFDAIVIPDAMPRSIVDGYAPGSIPGEYAGGLGEAGVEALRSFVDQGGTLIAFNNASLMAIDQLHLPVANILSGFTNDQFYCSGSLLRVELRDLAHPALWGMPREPIVMFELGPAFEQKSGFRGVVLATYPRDRDPLESGYLLHPERIQGKAAALEVFQGDGRIYLFGFKPQWRGQSHGDYKLVFNAIYDAPSMARPSTFQRPAEPATPQMESWSGAVGKVHADLAALLRQNRAFFAARGPAAVEERGKLAAAVDQFEKERISEIEDAAAGLDEAGKRRASDYVRQLRRMAADLRTKEFESAVDAGVLAERYRLAAIEQEISVGPSRP